LEQEPPGGMACIGINEGSGEKVTFLRPKEWKGLKMVRSRKAFFYTEPDGKTKRKAFVKMYDVVGILDAKGAWVEVEFDDCTSEPKITTGWIKSGDFFPTL
jgi:hypothetical protein